MEVDDGWRFLLYRYSQSPLYITADNPLTKTVVGCDREEDGGREEVQVGVVLTSMWRVLHRTAMRCFEWEELFCRSSNTGEGSGIALSGQQVTPPRTTSLQVRTDNPMLVREIVQDFTSSGQGSIVTILVVKILS